MNRSPQFHIPVPIPSSSLHLLYLGSNYEVVVVTVAFSAGAEGSETAGLPPCSVVTGAGAAPPMGTAT